MAQFEFTIVEMVRHQHSLIIECECMEQAQMIADSMEDEDMQHPDDIVPVAEAAGANVVEFNKDYLVDTDYIEIYDIDKEKED
ncbi:hypothetical protein D7Y05_08170 [bacterium 1XD42-54]|nr:hypothetical protein D7Y05_08170 [bacterium 1XD42-54]